MIVLAESQKQKYATNSDLGYLQPPLTYMQKKAQHLSLINTKL